ncbi:MAG: ABC transporter permease [Candidatus Marsarchaeota archaeon]|nr:ABC transporter permease [Candidatus Marsarchaeota archaeon]
MASLPDLLHYSLTSLRSRSLRSYLTVLGIVIGVAAVVSLISISDGLMASVEEQLQAFGPRNAVVMPGDVTGMAMSGGGYAPPSQGRLFEKDFERVRSVPGTTYVSRALSVRAPLEFRGETITASANGIEPELFSKMMKISVSEGRFLDENEEGTAVIGQRYADKSIFKRDSMYVGSVFYLGEQKKKFRVVGILDPSSSVSKSMLLIPFDDAKELAQDAILDDELSSIRFQVAEGYDFDETIGDVTWALASSRGVKLDKKDFSIVTSAFILQQVGQIIGVLTAFLGFITAVSLVVGGVGVANTMYMSVMERTREIGTLRAVGASSRDILSLVVIESAIIGLAGGAIGLLIGWLISLAVSFFGFKAVVSIWLALSALLFSVMLGVVSGFLPAQKAAKLSPVAAMEQG